MKDVIKNKIQPPNRMNIIVPTIVKFINPTLPRYQKIFIIMEMNIRSITIMITDSMIIQNSIKYLC